MWGWIAKLLIVVGVFYAIYHVGVKAERGVQEIRYALLAKDYATFREETKLAGAVAIAKNEGLKNLYGLQARTSKEKYEKQMARNAADIAKYKSKLLRNKQDFRAALDNFKTITNLPETSVCQVRENELSRRLARLDERGLHEIVNPALAQQEYALSCNQQLIEIEAIRTKK